MPRHSDDAGLHPALPSPWKDAMMFFRALSRRWRWIVFTLVFFAALSVLVSLCIGRSFRIAGNILFPIPGEPGFNALRWNGDPGSSPDWNQLARQLRELAEEADSEDADTVLDTPPLPLMTISLFNRMQPVLVRSDTFLARVARVRGAGHVETRYLRRTLAGRGALGGYVKKEYAYNRSELGKLAALGERVSNHLAGLELRMRGTSPGGARHNLEIWARHLEESMTTELIRLWIRRQRVFLGRINRDYQKAINRLQENFVELRRGKPRKKSRTLEAAPAHSRLAAARRHLRALRREYREMFLWRRCLAAVTDRREKQESLLMADVDRILGRFRREVTNNKKFPLWMQNRVCDRVRSQISWAIQSYADMIEIDLPGAATAVPLEPGMWTLLLLGLLLGIPVSLVLACGADRVLAQRGAERREKDRMESA